LRNSFIAHPYDVSRSGLKEINLGHYLKNAFLALTPVDSACKCRFMKHIYAKSTLRFVAAMLITVAIIGVSAVATHTPVQNQSSVTLKNIQTDRATTLYANGRPDCAWFNEAVYADQRPSCAWFNEAVLPTGDSKLMTENLQSVAATL